MDKHQNISYSNIWQLNDYWGIVQKASTLQNMAIEKHLIIEWVTGWVSEAWPLGGFLMHGHWMGFWDGFLRHGCMVGFLGMFTGWVSEWPPVGFLRHGH